MMRWNSIFAVVAAMLACLADPLQAQQTFKTLKVGNHTFHNVQIANRTPTDVYISHDGGFLNLKVEELSPELRAELGYLDEPEPAAKPVVSLAKLQENPRIQAVQQQLTQTMEHSVLTMDQGMVAGLLVISFVIYLFMSYCSMLICRNAGSEPGVLIWIPGLQMFPLLRAAGMSGLWFVAFFVPLVNLLASVIWCLKIAQACGKSVVVGVLLLLPITNFFAFLYLAFSGNSETDGSLEPIRLNLSES